ncbi:hypothetical protein DPMN_163761 [Dreissena polymorpha]|uniref:Orange domain-containing protein n=1 Tax=Dreissena polymorpha TaxID=45954 RepID=A0A9D4EUJ8_DREPO|nr:hypothetical protein DPMN_163761 [Dreissena polymorpha]
MTRVDKADILDLTVFHLQHQQQRQNSVSKTTESIAYTSGFQACAREVLAYLTNQKYADPKTISAISGHLHMALNVPQRCVRNQMPGEHNMSTPVRANNVRKLSSYPLNTPGVSPIANQNLLSREYSDGLSVPANNYRLAYPSHDSSIDSCYSSMNVSSLENSDVISEPEGVVSIGHRDTVGHVIMETLSSPF